MKSIRNEIIIRKASENDIDILIDYRIIFLKEVQGTPSNEKEELLRQTLRKYFLKSLKNGSYVAWIAEYQNRPVGFSAMVIREQPGNFQIPNGLTGYVLNMFTHKDFRRQGIASALFQKLIEEAKILCLDRIDLLATVSGECVYRQFGFKEPDDTALELTLN